MTTYCEGPDTVAELLARYREVKRRLHPAASPAAPREFTVQDAEGIFTFVLAAAVVMAERARQSERQAAETRRHVGAESPRSKARGAVRAVSKRTGVSVDDTSAAKKSTCPLRRATRPYGASAKSWSGRSLASVISSPKRTTLPRFIPSGAWEDRAARNSEIATAGAGRAARVRRKSSGAFRAPLQRDRFAVCGRGRGRE